MRRLASVRIALLLACAAWAAPRFEAAANEQRSLTAGSGGGPRTGAIWSLHDDAIGQPVVGSAASASFRTAGGFVNEQTFDFTAPDAPVVRDGTAADTDRIDVAAVCANWVSSDRESGIYGHLLGLGTTPLADDVVPLEQVGAGRNACLGATPPPCTTYYFVVAAQNGSGLIGPATASDGFFLDAGPDIDGDGLGNVCDDDDDDDGQADVDDVCPCDIRDDEDGDGWCAGDSACGLPVDNCADAFNPAQRDANGDGRGDACVDPCTLYVDPDPTVAADCRSIEECIDIVPRHCRVSIAAGVYDESPVLTRPVTLEGAGAAVTTLRGGPGAAVVTVLAGATPSVIRGLRLIGGDAGLEIAGGTSVEDSALTAVEVGALVTPDVQGAVRFSDTTIEATRVGLEIGGGQVMVERCRIRGSSLNGLEAHGGSVVTVSSSVIDAHGGTGIVVHPGAALALRASTVTRCQTGLLATASSTVTVAGSIVHGNTLANLDGTSCAGVSLSATATDCCAVGRNICVDPRFVDPASGDYRLRSDSPCLDSGATLDEYDGVPCIDFVGEPRVADGNGDGVVRADRGAFERPSPAAGATIADLRFAGAVTLEWSPSGAAPFRVFRGDLSLAGYTTPLTCLGETGEPTFDLSGEPDPAPGEGVMFLVGTSGTAASRAIAPGTCAERRAPAACP